MNRKNILLQTAAIFTLILFVSFDSLAGSKKLKMPKDSAGPDTTSTASAPNLQESANSTKKSNDSSAMISKVIGAAMMGYGGKCASQCGGGNPGCCAMAPVYFLMGAQSFMQAKNNAGSAKGAGYTGVDTSAWNNPFGDPNSGVDHLSGADSAADKDLAAHVNMGKFKDIKNKLLGSGIGGIKLDPKTGILTDRDGKKYDTSKSLANSGFSGDAIATAMGEASKAEKAIMKKLGVTTEGIGAATAELGSIEGGSRGSYSGNLPDVGGGDRGIASSGAGVKIPSNQIAGLSKNFNGERIGVSAENIFNMMTRRYKTKEKQNSFFDPSELTKIPQ